jgi:hypothetical protein
MQLFWKQERKNGKALQDVGRATFLVSKYPKEKKPFSLM